MKALKVLTFVNSLFIILALLAFSPAGQNWTPIQNLLVRGDANLLGNIYDQDSTLTVTDDALIDGQTDAVQLTVQGYSTQTSNVFEIENSAGTANAVIDNNGKGTFAGGIHLSGDGTGWLTLGAQTAISMTAGSIITPTGTFQPLESAAAVTSSTTTAVLSGTTTGDLLILQNTNASDAIIIDGTGGNVECGGNVSLTAGLSMLLFWDGANWRCPDQP